MKGIRLEMIDQEGKTKKIKKGEKKHWMVVRVCRAAISMGYGWMDEDVFPVFTSTVSCAPCGPYLAITRQPVKPFSCNHLKQFLRNSPSLSLLLRSVVKRVMLSSQRLKIVRLKCLVIKISVF